MANPEKLEESFGQSLRELWVIVAAWVGFALWTTLAGSLLAFQRPDEGGTIATTLGMPRWVFFTVLLPWIVGNLFIFWFAMWYMKDTDLEEDKSHES